MLQRFESIQLVPEAQPPNSRPPAEWAADVTGPPRKKTEQTIAKSHLTLYAEVRPIPPFGSFIIEVSCVRAGSG